MSERQPYPWEVPTSAPAPTPAQEPEPEVVAEEAPVAFFEDVDDFLDELD